MTLVYTNKVVPGRPGKEVSRVGLEVVGGFTGEDIYYGTAVTKASGKYVNVSSENDLVEGVMYASSFDPLGEKAKRACDIAIKGHMRVRVEKEVVKDDPVYIRFRSYKGKKRGSFTNSPEVVAIDGVDVTHAVRLPGKVYLSDTFVYSEGLMSAVRIG